MVRTCGVIDCLKTSEDEVALFKFPSDEKSAFYWKTFLEKANRLYDGYWKMTKTMHLCSQHFPPDLIETLPSNRRKLRSGAFPSTLNGEIIVCKNELDAMYEASLINIRNEELLLSTGDSDIGKQDDDGFKELERMIIGKDKEIERLRTCISDLEKYKNKLEDDLGKKKSLISTYQKKLKVYEQKESRRVASQKRKSPLQINEARVPKQTRWNRLDDDALAILDELKSRGESAPNQSFSEKVRDFSFGIHYHSTRAYEKMRQTISTLPCPSSFIKWTSHVKIAPGFINHSFEFIKARISTSPYQLYYALSVDEVHIRKQILPYRGEFIGHVNYGDIADSVVSNKEASAALFVMANEINGFHKMPLGYILTNGLSSSTLSQVIKNSIVRLTKQGGRVLTVTFDGLPSNFTAVEHLGARLNVLKEDFKPFFKVNLNEPTSASTGDCFVIFDPSHMLKLFRNLFKEYGILVNEKEEVIKWDYIVQLSKLQEAEGLRAANKITIRHVNYQNQKMKTKLAAQTLSGSAAIALRFVREIKIPGFEATQATEELLNVMNKLFDIMNSVRRGSNSRRPLTWSMYSEVHKFFCETKAYLLSLKRRNYQNGVPVDTPLIQTPRKTAIRGLVITMESLELIMLNVLSDPNCHLKYLPTFKISQDPLENFFCILRSRFGFNNNPNVLQLQQGVKGIICMKTKSHLNGNCVEQEETSTKISPLGNFNTIIEDDALLHEDMDEVNEEVTLCLKNLSLFVSNIVMYMSGFVATKLIKTIDCPDCILKLYPTEDDIPLISSDSTLTQFRDRGGLFISSFGLLSVCKIVEQTVRAKEGLGLQRIKENAVVNHVVHECIERGIAARLNCGYIGGNESHCVRLIKSITRIYCKTKFKDLGDRATLKICPTTNRSVNTKNTLFAGN